MDALRVIWSVSRIGLVLAVVWTPVTADDSNWVSFGSPFGRTLTPVDSMWISTGATVLDSMVLHARISGASASWIDSVRIDVLVLEVPSKDTVLAVSRIVPGQAKDTIDILFEMPKVGIGTYYIRAMTTAHSTDKERWSKGPRFRHFYFVADSSGIEQHFNAMPPSRGTDTTSGETEIMFLPDYK